MANKRVPKKDIKFKQSLYYDKIVVVPSKMLTEICGGYIPSFEDYISPNNIKQEEFGVTYSELQGGILDTETHFKSLNNKLMKKIGKLLDMFAKLLLDYQDHIVRFYYCGGTFEKLTKENEIEFRNVRGPCFVVYKTIPINEYKIMVKNYKKLISPDDNEKIEHILKTISKDDYLTITNRIDFEREIDRNA
jgi:hypothetical protein